MDYMGLRELCDEDAEYMLEWMKDEDINRYFRFDSDQMTLDEVKQFIKSANEKKEDVENMHRAIVSEENIYLGTVSLKNIDLYNKNAEYAISLRKYAQGKGVASRATNEILRIGFEDLHLNKIYLNVLSYNYHAIEFYKRLGFQYEGEFRKHILVKGNYESLMWFSILRCEYRGS